MIFQSQLEQKLVENGYNSFSLQDKNNLIALLANREGLLYSAVNDDYILQHHRDLKIELFDEMCENKIIAGFESSNGHTYRCNRDDQLNMIGKKDQLMYDTTIETVYWRTEDSGYVALSRDEFLIVYREALSHKENTIFKYNDLKKQIIQAKNHDDIVAIIWE